jgi:MYXO-CTERM domain-containing protein
MRIAVLTAALVVPSAAIADTGDHEVIGGAMTPEGEYPGVGALYLPSLGGVMCTGTLIAPDVVLTAAHCLEPLFIGSEVPGFTMVHDATGFSPPVTAGMRAMQHPMFNIGADPGTGIGTWYDIGLLFLAQPVTDVDPIRIPTVDEAAMLQGGVELELVGYGRTSLATDDVGIMFDAVAPIVLAGPAELQISHPGEPQNCHGDSGGPALIDLGTGYRVVGVVSRSADGAECNTGGVDTRVDFYTNWIFDESGVCAPGDDRCPDNELPDGDGGGCCSTSSSDPTGATLLVLGVALILARRRNPRPYPRSQ